MPPIGNVGQYTDLHACKELATFVKFYVLGEFLENACCFFIAWVNLPFIVRGRKITTLSLLLFHSLSYLISMYNANTFFKMSLHLTYAL